MCCLLTMMENTLIRSPDWRATLKCSTPNSMICTKKFHVKVLYIIMAKFNNFGNKNYTSFIDNINVDNNVVHNKRTERAINRLSEYGFTSSSSVSPTLPNRNGRITKDDQHELDSAPTENVIRNSDNEKSMQSVEAENLTHHDLKLVNSEKDYEFIKCWTNSLVVATHRPRPWRP